MDPDLILALQLDRELNGSNYSPAPAKKFKPSPAEKETSIVNSEWEITDPNPDIHMLFQVFNKKYFWGRLDCVEVKWSPRMYSERARRQIIEPERVLPLFDADPSLSTRRGAALLNVSHMAVHRALQADQRCAGICTYKGKLGGCVIALSLPLLKLRPRKDLVETLLHEMIHAFLFVADKNRDRGEHGPKFHAHMHRINKEAGTKITVYHTFHDEVKHYKQHWWKCNGPCQGWKPFFGLVKRSMNRAPGPNDFWFADHQSKCGGEFIKIKEPENFKSRKPKNKNISPKSIKKVPSTPSLSNIFPTVSKKGNNDLSKVSNVHGFTDLSKPSECSSNFVNQSTPKRKAEFGGTGLKSKKGSSPLTNFFPQIPKKVNNVHGFTDLSKPSQSRTNYGSQASTKPKAGFGGTGLKSNKGGTLILNPTRASQCSDETDENRGKAPDARNGIDVFSGSGHKLVSTGPVLSLAESRAKLLEKFSAKPRQQPSTSSSKEKLPSDERPTPELRSDSRELDSLNDFSDSDSETNSDCKKSLVHCPVCGKEMYEDAMNEHLDSCATLDSVFENSNCVDLSEDLDPEEENNSPADLVNCPVCGISCKESEINDHLDGCLSLINSD